MATKAFTGTNRHRRIQLVFMVTNRPSFEFGFKDQAQSPSPCPLPQIGAYLPPFRKAADVIEASTNNFRVALNTS
jgi:hypothetical protein